jgi:hypothetical protein
VDIREYLKIHGSGPTGSQQHALCVVLRKDVGESPNQYGDTGSACKTLRED